MITEDPAARLLRLKQEGRCGALVRELKTKLGPGEGVALFLVDYGEGHDGGSLSYAATIDRDDMRRAVAEWLHKTGGLDMAIAEYIEEQIEHAKGSPPKATP